VVASNKENGALLAKTRVDRSDRFVACAHACVLRHCFKPADSPAGRPYMLRASSQTRRALLLPIGYFS